MLFTSLRIFMLLSILTGGLYPALVTALAQGIWSQQANGSLQLGPSGQPVGSALLAQPFKQAGYFWPRPSAADFATVASGASQLGPTSAALRKQVLERRQYWQQTHGLSAEAPVPDELLLASGSGLDPELSPAAARFQAQRVAQARGLPLTSVFQLITDQTQGRQLGVLGEPRINVLALNLALDQLSGQKPTGQSLPPHASEQG